MNTYTIVYIGDIVEVFKGFNAGRTGVVIHCNSDQSLVRLLSTHGTIDEFWFPNGWIRPVIIAEKNMEDTRDYLKTITGDT